MNFVDIFLIVGFLLLLFILRVGIINIIGFIFLLGILFIINSILMKKYPPNNTKHWAGGIAKHNEEAKKKAIKLVSLKQRNVGIILMLFSLLLKIINFDLNKNPVFVTIVILLLISIVSYPSWSVEREIRKEFNNG